MLITNTTTLNEWLTAWLGTYKFPMVKDKTAEGYLLVQKHFQLYTCYNKPVRSITEMDLQKMLNQIAAKGLSKSFLKKCRYTLRQSFRSLIRQGELKTDPTTDLKLPIAPEKQILPLTHAEQERVEAACQSDPLGHIILFLLETGLRRAELMCLEWQYYNPYENSIYLHKSKTPAGCRKVYLTSKAKAIIDLQPRTSKYIFLHTRGGQITPTVLRRLVNRLRSASGVANLACHVCRHTFVTRLCEKGVPAKAIAQIIGHARADYVLDIYARMEADELRKAIYALDPTHGATVLGSEIRLPVSLYQTLADEAKRQLVGVDVLATHILQTFVDGK